MTIVTYLLTKVIYRFSRAESLSLPCLLWLLLLLTVRPSHAQRPTTFSSHNREPVWECFDCGCNLQQSQHSNVDKPAIRGIGQHWGENLIQQLSAKGFSLSLQHAEGLKARDHSWCKLDDTLAPNIHYNNMVTRGETACTWYFCKRC